jgi:hypothetical protein
MVLTAESEADIASAMDLITRLDVEAIKPAPDATKPAAEPPKPGAEAPKK